MNAHLSEAELKCLLVALLSFIVTVNQSSLTVFTVLSLQNLFFLSTETAYSFPGHTDLNNHRETILITAQFSLLAQASY